MTARLLRTTAAALLLVVIAAACGLRDERVDRVTVVIDVEKRGATVSPLIRGVSGGLTIEELVDAGITLVSWGGNPSTRYNYELGHAWNHGADFEFRNVNYGTGDGDAFAAFAADNAAAGAETRLAVPTLGWIAKDDDPDSCSFPDRNGGCEAASQRLTCERRERVADPKATSVESTPSMVSAWIEELLATDTDVRFIAMDNEPELWGHTHYDVHPTCTTFEEVLDRYVTYSRTIRALDPDVELLGPVTCCWFDYWGPDVEPADGSDVDFVTWFLRAVRAADADFGRRTLDVLDVHYYPQSDVYNDETDQETNGRRLRSTRSLWDPGYTDESWIGRQISFLPRLRQIVDDSYPGTRLAISEWNFGADHTVNGALAIADVLGIFGREGVYLAAYWFAPAANTPGYYAFKMHGNYDDAGSAFEGETIVATSSHDDVLGAYAVVDERSDVLRLMLINKAPDVDVRTDVELRGFDPSTVARRFTYGAGSPGRIRADSITWTGALVIPAYSIVVLELRPTT